MGNKLGVLLMFMLMGANGQGGGVIVPPSQFSDGDSIAISGSGFGSNSGNQEYSSDWIKTHALGEILVNPTNWDVDDKPVYVVNDPDGIRGRMLYSEGLQTNSQWQQPKIYDYGSGIPEDTIVYVSWVTEFEVEVPDCQHKMLRMSYLKDYEDGDTEIAIFNWPEAAAHYYVRPQAGSTNQQQVYLSALPATNQRCRCELVYYTGSQASFDGWVRINTYPLDNINTRSTHYETGLRVYNDANRHRYAVFQDYSGNFDGGATDPTTVAYRDHYSDDHYIQVGSGKRVVLANSPDLSTATLTQIQPWNSWADTSVSITLKAHGVAAGTYYVHITDVDSTSLGYRQIQVI